MQHEVRRSLTINGFLLPAHGASMGEFVPLDWTAVSAAYGVANNLLASCYHDVGEGATPGSGDNQESISVH